jgi:urease accessory protein
MSGAFLGGLLHPIFVPTHMLALAVTGIVIGQQAPRARWMAMALFCGAMLLGFFVIVQAFAPRHVGEILLALAGAGGVMIALGRRLPQFVACGLAVAAGGAVALDSPPQAISVLNATITLFGTFWGASLLVLAAAVGASLLSREWQRVAVRILGSWIAASAMLALALALGK